VGSDPSEVTGDLHATVAVSSEVSSCPPAVGAPKLWVEAKVDIDILFNCPKLDKGILF